MVLGMERRPFLQMPLRVMGLQLPFRFSLFKVGSP